MFKKNENCEQDKYTFKPKKIENIGKFDLVHRSYKQNL